MPGKPRANVEKSRCKTAISYSTGEAAVIPKKVGANHSFEVLKPLELNDSPFQPDHRGVGSVVCAQFREDIPDLALDGFFAH